MTGNDRPAVRISEEMRRRVGVYGVTGAIGATAFALLTALSLAGFGPVAGPEVPFWALVGLYAATEAAVIHIAIRKETHSFSLTEVPLVVGAFTLAPVSVVLAQVLGAGVVLLLIRRQAPLKLLFNILSFALATTVGLTVFHLLTDPSQGIGPRSLFAAYAAAVTTDLVTALCVEIVIRVSTGEPMNLRLRSTSAIGFTLLNATLGIAVIVDWVGHVGGLWMPLLMGIGLYAGYRLWTRERHRQERLADLQGTSHEIQGSLGSEGMEAAIVREVRRLFGAHTVELILPLQGGDEVRRVQMIGDAAITSRVHAERDLAPSWRDLLRGDAGALLQVAGADLDGGGRPDAGRHSVLAAPVPVTERTRGLLALVDREAKVGAWPADELPLLETLGNQIAVTLRNAQLLENVEARAAENEYLARHDTLTGLPNRDWLRQLIDDALRREATAPAAVLVAELTGFRELVETLGHDNADQVLRAVAKRLVAHAGPDRLVGRLDGHDLAVVIPGPASAAQVRDQARSLVDALHEPFPVDDLLLGLTIRVGLALTGAEERVDARTLLRRAEIAIRTAETDDEEIAEYDPVRDAGSPVRMSLVGELRRALDERELTVLYQPKVSLATRRIVGAEALIRWMHPTRGMIPPDEFIPVAERSNVLRPMTLFVLELALARCEAWRAGGGAQGVAVNLSVRNLLDSRIVDDVDRLIRRSEVPPEALTLEITESAAMLDPARARAVMTELRGLGVRLAIDDFGAGYASLAYLKQLPANELKIDKAFMHAIDRDPRDRAIVKSSIDLAHDLGLKVVAEGVETQAAMDLLAELGADLVQGWHLGRPMSAEAFDDALRGDRMQRGASVA